MSPSNHRVFFLNPTHKDWLFGCPPVVVVFVSPPLQRCGGAFETLPEGKEVRSHLIRMVSWCFMLVYWSIASWYMWFSCLCSCAKKIYSSHLGRQAQVRMVFAVHEIWIWENTSYWITMCCAGKSWNQIQTIFVFTVSVKLLNPPSVYIYLCMKIVNNKMWWTIFTITTSGNRTTSRIQMKQSNYILLTMTLLLLTYVTKYFYTWSYQTSYSRHYIYIYAKYIYTLWFQRMYLTCSRATRIYQDLLAYIVYNRVFCRYVRAMLPVCSSTNASIVVRIFPV